MATHSPPRQRHRQRRRRVSAAWQRPIVWVSATTLLLQLPWSSTAFVAPSRTLCLKQPIRRGGGGAVVSAMASSPTSVHDPAADGEPSFTNQETTLDQPSFNLATALLCGGLAFDAYVEPPEGSSRWERGSKGLNVGFVSSSFTRNLYKGLLEITPVKITDLPDEQDTAEGLMTGGGTDAYLLVAAVEGQWKEDIDMLEKGKYHEGVLGLLGAAHQGRSRTAWSNVGEKEATRIQKRKGLGVPYHIKSQWGKGGQAVYLDEPPFYVYIQDPAKARLVFTVMDEEKIYEDLPIGSAHKQLASLIPDARLSQGDMVQRLKDDVLEQMKSGKMSEIDLADKNLFKINAGPKAWTGDIKLSSKPTKKDKKGQVAMATAAGAMILGPAGAAVGGIMASMYEGEIRGSINVQVKYIPIPQVEVKRKIYDVKGGLPGIDWGELYEKHSAEQVAKDNKEALSKAYDSGDDLEQCFVIKHDKTGCSCCVYRSLQKRLIVVSFRGTCEPKDILTDASIIQDAWVDGEDIKEPGISKVHAGFRKSLNSVTRRLKELIIATVEPGEELSQYDMLVTGHSLGGALSTLFVADIAEYGVDAGRALPQLEPSEAWWSSIASRIAGKATEAMNVAPPPPPRPKSLCVYNFGSPRVGNEEFCEKFESLQKSGFIDEAYRVVNGDDIVARNPRTMNALALGSIGYDHCGPTVLVSHRTDSDKPSIWVEGESDDGKCPVRDGSSLKSPLSKGTLLGDLYDAAQGTLSKSEEKTDIFKFASKVGSAAGKMTDRLSKVSGADITSVIGIDKEFTDREVNMVKSVMSGEAISNHMEDKYYGGMGRAAGFVAKVGEEIKQMEEIS